MSLVRIAKVDVSWLRKEDSSMEKLQNMAQWHFKDMF